MNVCMLPEKQIMLTEEQIEKNYWDLLKYDSHRWVEQATGYYQCEYCKANHTSMMPINNKNFCKENPHLKYQNHMTNKEEFETQVPKDDSHTLSEISEWIKIREVLGDSEQTAVEWLVDWMNTNQSCVEEDLLEAVHTARVMEYFQLKKMYRKGSEDFINKVQKLSNK